MIHQLSPEQVYSLAAEHAPQIALSVAVANEHAARTPFSSIVAAVEHDLHDLLENLRIAGGGDGGD